MPARWNGDGRCKIYYHSGRAIGNRIDPRVPITPSAVKIAPGVLNRTLVNQVMGLELESIKTWINLP